MKLMQVCNAAHYLQAACGLRTHAGCAGTHGNVHGGPLQTPPAPSLCRAANYVWTLVRRV